jgi:hypothetical protein
MYIPVESVRTEYRDKYLRDSFYVHDSSNIYVNGDTVREYLYRYIYRDRFMYDTISICDTIREPYPVEKALSKWQQTKMNVGGWAIGGLSCLVLLGIVYGVFKIKKRYFSIK